MELYISTNLDNWGKLNIIDYYNNLNDLSIES